MVRSYLIAGPFCQLPCVLWREAWRGLILSHHPSEELRTGERAETMYRRNERHGS